MSRSLKVRKKYIPKVKAALKPHGFLRQKDLAEELEISLCTVSNFLNGKPVDNKYFVDISEKLGLDSQEIAADFSPEDTHSTQSPEITSPRQDLRDAPDLSVFYGRKEKLIALRTWIVENRYRLVPVYGMGGIGKTTVARQLVEEIQDEFEFVIWRSLRNAPKLKDLLSDLIQFLSEPEEDPLPDREDELISQLMKYLRQRRCILVIEDWQMLLSSGQLAGVYKDGYEGYGELLKRVAELHHNSCLLLTSWEKPVEMAELLAKTLPVGALQLQGLEAAAARKILKQQDLCDENSWGELIKVYRGNPLALKMVSTTIKELFAGKVSEFIKDTWIFGNMNYFLGKHFKRLSEVESEIMYLLAKKNNGLNIQELQFHIGSMVSPPELLEAVESLKRRSLIETSPETGRQSHYTLQPVVMQYVKGLLNDKKVDTEH